jgi:hypothetical protein
MKNYYFIVLAFILFGCKAAYEPPVTTDLHNYLIVKGTINSSTDSTYIKLSRTVSLQSKIGTFNPELHAQVIVEDGQNYNYILKELGKGVYAAGPLGLDNSKKYRVRIKTGDGKVYLSELSAVTYTPPIDSIGFNLVNGAYSFMLIRTTRLIIRATIVGSLMKHGSSGQITIRCTLPMV